MRDEQEDEEQEEVSPSSITQAPRNIPQQVIPSPSPVDPNQVPQVSDSVQMPPPQARPNSTPQRRKTPTHPASENSKGFRPFSLSLSKSRRNEASQRLRSFTTRDKAADATNLPSAGAEATSQVVEALKAMTAPERTALPPTPGPTPLTASTQNPNDPYRFSVYERVTMVGEGTYGKVYKAKNKNTYELVALKRIRMESERDGVYLPKHHFFLVRDLVLSIKHSFPLLPFVR